MKIKPIGTVQNDIREHSMNIQIGCETHPNEAWISPISFAALRMHCDYFYQTCLSSELYGSSLG